MIPMLQYILYIYVPSHQPTFGGYEDAEIQK